VGVADTRKLPQELLCVRRRRAVEERLPGAQEAAPVVAEPEPASSC
jgi:hypothetical protein